MELIELLEHFWHNDWSFWENFFNLWFNVALLALGAASVISTLICGFFTIFSGIIPAPPGFDWNCGPTSEEAMTGNYSCWSSGPIPGQRRRKSGAYLNLYDECMDELEELQKSANQQDDNGLEYVKSSTHDIDVRSS